MKKPLFFLILIVIFTALFTMYFGLYEARYFIGRASVSNASFSVDNSYLFVSPLKAKANGQERIRVTVFILNNQGVGVLGKKVVAGVDSNISVETIQGLTDGFGKAVFDITSQKSGEYYLEMTADGIALKQKAHVSFE